MVELFLSKGIFQIKDLDFGVSNQNSFFIAFKNNSFTNLSNITFKIHFSNENFLNTIKDLTFQNQYQDVNQIDDFSADLTLG